MSTRKDFRLVKFEIKKNSQTVEILADVPKRAFTQGKVKEGNYISFGSEDYWKILSAKRFSIFNRPPADVRIYGNAKFKESK